MASFTSMEEFREEIDQWRNVRAQQLMPLKEPGLLVVTKGLGTYDWPHLMRPREAFYGRADDANNLAFELRFMDEYVEKMDPPTQMNVNLKPVYSLDRDDLAIWTSNDRVTEGHHSWREMRFGMDLTKSEKVKRLYGHFYISAAGREVSAAIQDFQSTLEQCYSLEIEHDLEIMIFVHQMLRISVKEMTECLRQNSDFLWDLSQRFADEVKPSSLRFSKEFYQISFRMIGLTRRLKAIRDANDLVKTNDLVRACVASDPTGRLQTLQFQIDQSLEPLDGKIKYINDSFDKLNAMVVDVTSAKRADDANDLSANGYIIAFAALAYSPAALGIGMFGMELHFIEELEMISKLKFVGLVLLCYVPVALFFIWRWTMKFFRNAPVRLPQLHHRRRELLQFLEAGRMSL